MNLEQWGIKWGVPAAALQDLRQSWGVLGRDEPPEAAGKSEAWAQSMVRLEASQKGMRLWRNNVGALQDERGVPVRYGLANHSKQINEVLKSGDLIGIRPVLVTPVWLGCTLGQFVSREIKEPGWRYTGTEREVAQLKWLQLVNSLGGDAAFATGTGTL